MYASPSYNPSYVSSIGRRFSMAGKVYLAEDQGVRWIASPAVYNSLFRDWNGIEALDGSTNPPFNQAPVGPPMADGTMLAKDPNAPEVYLIDQGWKRHIVSPAVMDQYSFSGSAIQALSGSALAGLPTGDPITGTVSIFLADQLHALSENALLWNHWRDDYPGVIISLILANLTNANLARANLSGVDLTQANLSNADLYRANLSGAKLLGANLRGARLAQANLSGADLSGDDLSGDDLSGADVSGTNLSGVNLSFANLSGVDLTGANLTGARLFEADLNGAKVTVDQLHKIEQTDLNLTGVIITPA